MYYGDYGNYDASLNRPKYNLYQAASSQSVPQEPERLSLFNKSGDKLNSSIEPPNRNIPKVTVDSLPLSAKGMAVVEKYTTPEQADRIGADFVRYFA